MLVYSLVLLVYIFCGQAAAAPSVGNTSSSCPLPPFPRHGTYSISNYDGLIVPGDLVDKYTVLTYSCTSEDYQLSPNKRYSLCEEDNRWSTPPGCYRSCTLYSSYTVDYSCFSADRDSIPCKSNMIYGSFVNFECKTGHKLSEIQTLPTMRCRSDGTWSISLPDCQPICGLEKSEATPLIVNAPEARRDTVPWNVAIFIKKGGTFDHICGGSILNSRVIISAAHCFYNPHKKQILPKELFRVAANKFHRQWKHEDDSSEQTSQVLEIRLHEKYKGEELNQESDMALLVIETPFQFSDSLSAICYNLNNQQFDKHQLDRTNLGKVAGWGITEKWQPSERLRVLSLPFIEENECREELQKYHFSRHLTYDKFCGGYRNGTAICNGDSGAGLVFPLKSYETLWYLRGIVSVAPVTKSLENNNSYCRQDTYTAFTRVFALRDWLKLNLDDIAMQRSIYVEPSPALTDENISSSGCSLPAFPCHGLYSVSNRKKDIVTGERVPVQTVLTYSCEEDFIISDSFSICGENETWSSSPQCHKPCDMPTSYTVDFECTDARFEPINCTAKMPYGSLITSKCKNGHVTSEYLETLRCREGFWDGSTPRCSPKCGLEKAQGIPIILHGDTAKKDTFPWHVGIFKIDRNYTNYVCSGTLIHLHIVISAGHCFYDILTDQLYSPTFYKVAAGKLYREWDDEREKGSKTIQRSEVSQILLHDFYGKMGQYYTYNSALVVLTKPFSFSDSVSVVCYDLNNGQLNAIQTADGVLGKVSGWGLTETGHQSDELKTLTIPVINIHQCLIEMIKYYSEKILKSDTMCAGYTNGSAVCISEKLEFPYGAGLVIPAEDLTKQTRWYLRGVLSINIANRKLDTCASTYVISTMIYHNRDWLQQQLRRLT